MVCIQLMNTIRKNMKNKQKCQKMVKNGQKQHDFRSKPLYSTMMMKVLCVSRIFIHTHVLHLGRS